MAIKTGVHDQHGNMIYVRKESEDFFQVIFDDCEQEFIIELDKHTLKHFLKQAKEIIEWEDY